MPAIRSTDEAPISTRFRAGIKNLGSGSRESVPWVLGLFALVVMAVALGLTVGAPSPPLVWARVWGGPTEGPAPLALRVELGAADPTRQREPSVVGRLRVTDARGRSVDRALDFDSEATAFASIEQPLSDPVVTVLVQGTELAKGPIRLTRDQYWQQRAVRGGGWRGKREGDLQIVAGCREGVLAHGRPGSVGIVITDVEGRPIETDLAVEFEGLEPTHASLRSNAMGQATVEVLPTDLSASMRVWVGSRDQPKASYFSSIPVDTTGFYARAVADRLLVESLVPVSRVYYSLVNEQGRWAAGSLELECGATACRGHIEPRIPIPAPAWLMLGTDPSLDGPGVVGWPVRIADGQFITEAIGVHDRLLLDGKPAALARNAQARSRRFTHVLLGTVVAGAIVLFLLGWRLREAQRSEARLTRQLEPSTANRMLRSSLPSTVLLALLVVAALCALALWAKLRL